MTFVWCDSLFQCGEPTFSTFVLWCLTDAKGIVVSSIKSRDKSHAPTVATSSVESGGQNDAPLKGKYEISKL
jgi:hypothetical protein